MKSKADVLLSEALALPEQARAKLAGCLIDSLERADADAPEAWALEVDRRVCELETGTAKTVSWAQVRRKVLRSRREAKRLPLSRRG
jgi:putative addiction module component (TIGR02574 family)